MLKKMSISQQRKLYQMYKQAVISNLNNLDALYNTGNYSRPAYSEMVQEAKTNLLEFSSSFEEVLCLEIMEEMKSW